MRERFDLDALDPDDPFELDSGNLPHLAKHAPFTAEDALDAWTFGLEKRGQHQRQSSPG